MSVTANTRASLVKAFRVLLVFTLVFWSTFRIEMIALADEPENGGAAETVDNTTTPETPDTPDTPTDPTDPTEPDTPDVPADPTEPDTPADPTEPDTPTDPNGEEKESTLNNFEVHVRVDPPTGSTDPLAHVGDLVYSKALGDEGADQQQPPEISAVKGELTFVAVIDDATRGRFDASNLVEWRVTENANIADFTDTKDEQDNTVKTSILKASGESDAQIIAVCKLKSSALSQFNLPEGTTVQVAFKVNIVEQAGAYVTSIELLDKEGAVLPATEQLKLDLGANGSLSYQFAARVTVEDPAKDADPKTHAFTTAETTSLSDHDKELLADLKWSVSAEDGTPVEEAKATIDEKGLLKANDKIIARISCTSSKGHGGGEVAGSVTVNTGVEPGIQGESHPQSALVVTVQPTAAKAAADDKSGASADAGPSSGASSPAESGSSASAGSADDDAMTTQAEGDDPSDPSDPSGPADSADEASDANGSQDGAGASPDAGAAAELKKTYTVEDLAAFTQTTATYKLAGRAADAAKAAGSSDNTTTVTGTGVKVSDILEAAGADLDKVESVTFGSFGQEPVVVPWATIKAADQGDTAAILALRSYVHIEGEAEPTDADLLDNTRFRLLYGGASIGQAVPWVNSVTANGPQKEPEPESSLRAVIGYIPVKMGSTAILSASVVGLYSGEQFGYAWEESTDGGLTWPSELSPDSFTPYSTDQTIRIPTSEQTIGRVFRVIATTNQDRKAVSEPVTITEGTGFSITLAYDPPIAGEMAFFTSSVDNLSSGETVTDYIWEWTEDGGLTWQEIAGSRGKPTFSAKTDPIESSSEEPTSAESSDSASSASADKEVDKTPAPSIWIHVRAITSTGREATSNSVMLTVHVPEGEGAGQQPTPTDQPQGDPDPKIPDPNADPDDVSPVVNPTPATPVVQEVTSITTETAPREAAQQQTPEGTQSTPTPAAAAEAPTELVINPTVTAEILKQQEEVNEVVESTRPGARWTALSTVDPDGQDVRRILSGNPFVPFTAPFALGITAAGVVEKLLAFRRQVK